MPLYEIGQVMTVTGNSNGHRFELGEDIVINHFDTGWPTPYDCHSLERGTGASWWVLETEMIPKDPPDHQPNPPGHIIRFSDSFVKLLENCGGTVSELLLKARWNKYIVKPDAPDYITFREKQGLISYMPFGKTQEFTEDGTWKRECRQSCKAGKLVRMVLSAEITDKDIEQFTNCFKAYEKSNEVVFEIVSPEDAYDSRNYADRPDSCMWDKGYSRFYPKSCTALIAKTEKGWIGRALLWNEVRKGSGGEIIKVMDRIYAADDVKEMFKTYARENGFYHKLRQSYDNKDDFISPDGLHESMQLSIAHPQQDDFEDEYPYMDTFTYGDGMRLYNYECDNCRTYNETNGTRNEEDDHEGEVQLANGEWVNEDDAVEVDGEWYHIDDCVTCYRTDNWILLSDAYRIELNRNETIYIHRNFVTEPE